MSIELASALPSTAAIESDEKITPVMIYLDDQLIWGEVVTKVSIRVSIWLRSQAIPQFIVVRNANILRVTSNGASRPQAFSNLLIPSILVNAFHIKPPEADPPDYDPKEPMRKMSPTVALVGPFRFEGTVRMSTHTDLTRFLDVTKEAFNSMYDVTVTVPGVANLGPIKTPFTLIRENNALFSSLE